MKPADEGRGLLSRHPLAKLGIGKCALKLREQKLGDDQLESAVTRAASRRDWEFVLSPAQFIDTYYIEPAGAEALDLPVIHRDLALHMGQSAELNRTQLRFLTGAFRAGAILLVAEVVAWVAVLVNQS